MEKVARLLYWIVDQLNLATIRWIGRMVGSLVWWLAVKGRKQANKNLHRVFGDRLPESEINRLSRKSFINLVTTILELPFVVRNRQRIVELFEMEGYEHLLSATQKGKGVIILVPHMGNWEAPGCLTTALYEDVSAVVREQKPAWLNDLLSGCRQQYQLKEIHNKGALTECLSVLRRGGILYMLIDQHIRKGTVVVDFLGYPAHTSAAAALLALRTGCEVIPACSFRPPSGLFGACVHPVIPTVKTGNLEQDLITNTQNYVNALGVFVHEHPEDWMWMHNRWRVRETPAESVVETSQQQGENTPEQEPMG